MAAEVHTVNTALYGLLAADSTLQALIGNPARCYEGLAPQDTAYPYLRYQVLSAQDDNALAPHRAHTIYVYYIAAVTKDGSVASLATIMARVDALLYGTRQTPTGYVIDWLREEQVGPLHPVVQGVEYAELGQRWRSWAQAV